MCDTKWIVKNTKIKVIETSCCQNMSSAVESRTRFSVATKIPGSGFKDGGRPAKSFHSVNKEQKWPQNPITIFHKEVKRKS